MPNQTEEQTDMPQRQDSTDDRRDNETAVPEADEDLHLFLKTLKDDFPGRAGNKALRQKLGWDAEGEGRERYWETHGRAHDKGLVEKGGGKGGSVALVGINDSSFENATDMNGDSHTSSSEETTQTKESDLYPDASKVIEKGWMRSQNYDDHFMETTAFKGKAATGGRWSRPDIAVLATKSFPYLPGRQFDIITFEIKPKGQTDVQGVFEALSHQQFANKAYVVFHLGSAEVADNFAVNQSHGERILGTAKKHGVGIIIATNIADWETWDELVSAERHTPDPEQANRFIATCFSEETKERIIKWHK